MECSIELTQPAVVLWSRGGPCLSVCLVLQEHLSLLEAALSCFYTLLCCNAASRFCFSCWKTYEAVWLDVWFRCYANVLCSGTAMTLFDACLLSSA